MLMDTEKSFDKRQHPFIIKTPRKPEIEGIFLHLMKGIYQNKQINKNPVESHSSEILDKNVWYHYFSLILVILPSIIK